MTAVPDHALFLIPHDLFRLCDDALPHGRVFDFVKCSREAQPITRGFLRTDFFDPLIW